MWFLVSSLIFLVIDLFLLWYLGSSEYFGPFNRLGEIDLWNIGVFVFMISLAVGIVISVIVFLTEKVLYCGKREFPRSDRALRYGLLTMLCLAAGLMLHIFHFLNFGVLLVLFFLIVIGFVLVR